MFITYTYMANCIWIQLSKFMLNIFVSIGFCGKAIFSMWNDGNSKVSANRVGANVELDLFDNEGTGMNSIKTLNWKVGDKITFRMKGKFHKNNNVWALECKFKMNNQRHFMAAFLRPGQEDMTFTIYAFIEYFIRKIYINI